MRIATWNVNSVRQRLPRLLAWLAERSPDVVCLQETKLADEAFAEICEEYPLARILGPQLKTLHAKLRHEIEVKR